MMRFSFFNVLKEWLPLRGQHSWALGAIVFTSGSVYRKTGALMLFSDAGHQLGLLSGGCLESDLLLQARKVIALNQSREVSYDAQDESNVAWRLGIGCGGRADILLHPCAAENNYLELEHVYNTLESGQAAGFSLGLHEAKATLSSAQKNYVKRVTGENDGQTLNVLINPPPHLLISGGGADILSITHLADQLGWSTSIIAPRIKQEQKVELPIQAHFYSAYQQLLEKDVMSTIDAVIVANHNIDRDAEALDFFADKQIKYLGLLGPEHRKKEVLEKTQSSNLPPIAGPMGLALGGDLPENIALSVIAECHAVLYGSSAAPMSKAYL